MRFKDYLSEEITRPFTEEITENQAYDWIRTHARHYTDALFDDPSNAIFRGLNRRSEHHAYEYGDSSQFKRKAANTTNEMQLFVASSPKWKKFPSRESAFICATDSHLAGKYGELYMAIPADNAKIGICPTKDFWLSFEEGFDGTGFKRLDQVNFFLRNGIGWANGVERLSFSQKDPEALRADLRKVDLEFLDKAIAGVKTQDDASKYLRGVREQMKERGCDNLEELLEDMFDPLTNDFRATTAQDYDADDLGPLEVWIEGEACFIKVGWDDEGNYYSPDEFIEQLKEKIYP